MKKSTINFWICTNQSIKQSLLIIIIGVYRHFLWDFFYKQYHGDKTKVPTNTPTSHTLLTNVIIYNFAEDNSPRAENELVYALIFHLRLALCLEKLFVLFNVLYWMNFRIHFAITVAFVNTNTISNRPFVYVLIQNYRATFLYLLIEIIPLMTG